MLDGIHASSKPVVVLPKPDCVRVATIADERPLFTLLWEELHRDNDMGFPRDEKKCWAHVNGVCRGTHGIAGVIDHPSEPGKIIGAIGIVCSQQWYSEAWVLSEIFLFVHPEFRKSRLRLGDALFEFARWHRSDMEARTKTKIALEITVLSNKRLDAKERLWGRYGRKIGATFLIEGD